MKTVTRESRKSDTEVKMRAHKLTPPKKHTKRKTHTQTKQATHRGKKTGDKHLGRHMLQGQIRSKALPRMLMSLLNAAQKQCIQRNISNCSYSDTNVTRAHKLNRQNWKKQMTTKKRTNTNNRQVWHKGRTTGETPWHESVSPVTGFLSVSVSFSATLFPRLRG